MPSSPRRPNQDLNASQWPEEITLDYFYQPHTISILLLSISGLIITAFIRDTEVDPRLDKIESTLLSSCMVLLTFSDPTSSLACVELSFSSSSYQPWPSLMDRLSDLIRSCGGWFLASPSSTWWWSSFSFTKTMKQSDPSLSGLTSPWPTTPLMLRRWMPSLFLSPPMQCDLFFFRSMEPIVGTYQWNDCGVILIGLPLDTIGAGEWRPWLSDIMVFAGPSLSCGSWLRYCMNDHEFMRRCIHQMLCRWSLDICCQTFTSVGGTIWFWTCFSAMAWAFSLACRFVTNIQIPSPPSQHRVVGLQVPVYERTSLGVDQEHSFTSGQDQTSHSSADSWAVVHDQLAGTHVLLHASHRHQSVYAHVAGGGVEHLLC